jgi:hypothetical protein
MLETKEEVREYEDMGRLVIRYPLKGKYSRWYSSPRDDLYVGLKLNRLVNKQVFTHIVVCYTSNHMDNPTRETYKYYHGLEPGFITKAPKDIKTLKPLPLGRKGPIPRTMEVELGVTGYSRLGVGGKFIQCVEEATQVYIKDIKKDAKKYMAVVKQEFWELGNNEEEIHSLIFDVGDTTRSIGINGGKSADKGDSRSIPDVDGTSSYRLFEEMYECNIIVVEVGNDERYKVSIPRHKDYYIWETCKNYDEYVVILKNIRKLYHEIFTTYELICERETNTKIFPFSDPLITKLVAIKSMQTIHGTEKPKNVIGQYINEFGKCVLVKTKNGKLKECNMRPLNMPIMDVEKGILEQHMDSMVKLTGKERIWVTSTPDYIYFPDEDSFRIWYGE